MDVECLTLMQTPIRIVEQLHLQILLADFFRSKNPLEITAREINPDWSVVAGEIPCP